MNRGKNQNGWWLLDRPRSSPWVLRYAEHNARFPSETILIRMRVGGSETRARDGMAAGSAQDLLLDYRTFYLIT